MALTYLRIAGYHGDRALWTRVYVENRIGYQTAKKAWAEGERMKANGVGCTCADCQSKEPSP